MNRDFPSARNGKPQLDGAALEAMALRYVERYATSREKLARYLRRKLRERGWAGEGEAPVAAIVDRMARLRYVDDAQYAESRVRALTARGYGARRIGEALRADGIGAALGERAAADVDALDAVLRLARRRRIGPYADTRPDGGRAPEAHRKAIAVLVRGGHSLDLARRVAAAETVEELESDR